MVMKRLLLILCMVLWVGQAWAETGIDHADHFAAALFGGDSTYLYGVRSGQASSKLFRLNTSNQWIQPNGTSGDTALFDFATIISPQSYAMNAICMVYPSQGSTYGDGNDPILVAVVNDAGNYKWIMTSKDGGLHWGSNAAMDDGVPSYALQNDPVRGQVAHTVTQGVLSNRSFAENNGTIYFVSYGKNYEFQEVIKTTNGINWTRVVYWNSGCEAIDGGADDDPASVIKHLHHIHYDPYSEHFLITVGDLGATEGAGIIVWDGTTALTDNLPVTAENYPNSITANGAQKYLALGFNFSANYITWIAEAETPQSGIWRVGRTVAGLPDWTTVTSVNTDVDSYTGHRGGFALTTTGGVHLLTDSLVGDATDEQGIIWSSTDQTTWTIVGRWGWVSDANSKLFKAMFEWGGYAWLSSSTAAGKSDLNTVKISVGGTNKDDLPTIIHPVYYVYTAANGGNDSNNGWSSRTPWLTLEKALKADKITYGARVIVGTGTFDDQNAILIDWNGNTYTGTGTVVVEGQGMESTLVRHKAGDDANYLTYLADATYPVIWRDIAFDSKSAVTYLVRMHSTLTPSFYRVSLGSADYDRGANGAQLALNNGGTVKWCRFIGPATNADAFIIGGNSTTVVMHHNTFIGLNDISYINGRTDTTLELINNTFYNYSNRGIVFAPGTTFTSLLIKNNIFYGQVTNQDIMDLASLTETDSQIDYNYYFKGVTNVANSGGTNRKTAANGSITFRDAANNDLGVASGPVINAGANLCGVTASCTESGVPYACCTGEGAGNCFATLADFRSRDVCVGGTFVGGKAGSGPDIGAYEKSFGGLFQQFNKTNRFAPYRRLR